MPHSFLYIAPWMEGFRAPFRQLPRQEQKVKETKIQTKQISINETEIETKDIKANETKMETKDI